MFETYFWLGEFCVMPTDVKYLVQFQNSVAQVDNHFKLNCFPVQEYGEVCLKYVDGKQCATIPQYQVTSDMFGMHQMLFLKGIAVQLIMWADRKSVV